MRTLWCAALLGLGCLCGCTVRNPPAPPAPGPDVVAPAKPTLVGKWFTTGGESMEFGADGRLTIVRGDRPAVTAKYTLVEDGQLEVDLSPAVDDPLKAKVSYTPDELTFASQLPGEGFGLGSVKERKTTWKRTPPAEAKPGEGGADAQRVGRWKNAADKETYDFFADGTFAHYEPGEILDSVCMGTWKPSAHAATEIDCTYPDSGRTETILAAVSGGDMTLGRDDPKCPVAILRDARDFTRDGDPVPERKPIQAGRVTAYQLYQEFKANPEEAEKKYKGKELEIAGVVQSIASIGGGLFIKTKDKDVNEDLTETKLTLTTGEQENVLCVFPGLKVNIFDKSDDNTMNRCAFVVLKGTCLGMGEDEGAFKIGGDGPKVRFGKCKVVPAAAKPDDKK